ncbi:hypothetical protein B7486_45725 [cyanobacterium TDX16]|nr:hypothetical protein B7486_45725 [cyanobacterium TDX16]
MDMESDILKALSEIAGHMRVSAVADKLRDYPRPLAYEVERILRLPMQEGRDKAMQQLIETLPEDWAVLVSEDLLPQHVEEWQEFQKELKKPISFPLTGKEKAELNAFIENLRLDRTTAIEARFDDQKLKAKTRSELLKVEAEIAAELERFSFSERDIGLISGKEALLQAAVAKRQRQENNPLLKSRNGGLSPRGIRSKRKDYA